MMHSPSGAQRLQSGRSRLVLAAGFAAGFAGIAALALLAGCGAKKPEEKASAKPALTVTLTKPQLGNWSQRIQASGNVAAWQEASIGAEIGGLVLAEVLVNVGDTVRKGQLLARFNEESVKNDLAQQTAAVQEAEANLDQARRNIERARQLEPSGAISSQDIITYETQAATGAARLASAKSMLAAQQLRLRYTRVLAPDDGLISSRTATVGAVLQNGSELFRLIRKNRLEWRGELRADDLLRVTPGHVVEFQRADGAIMTGKVRQTAPTVDTATRVGLVYVDLPQDSRMKAGMFVSAAVVQGDAALLTIPQTSVVVRDGYSYAMLVAKDNRVKKLKLTLGKRHDSMIEVLSGLKAEDSIVAAGGSFLNEGDLVSVVDAPAVKTAPAPAAAAPGARP